VSPLNGNVVFGCTEFKALFTLESFAAMYRQKQEVVKDLSARARIHGA